MLKKIGIPVLAVLAMLAFTAPTPANAAVRVGIGLGFGPAYVAPAPVYVAPPVYPAPYVAPAPYVYPGVTIGVGGYYGPHYGYYGPRYYGHPYVRGHYGYRR